MSSVLVLCAMIGACSYFFFLDSGKKKAPYPPGPSPKPIVGNLFDVPTRKPWHKYLEMSKEHNSDIIHLSVFNNNIVVVHSMEAIVELLEKRSRNYSDRPVNIMFEFLGIEGYTPFKIYGDGWRLQRKLLKEVLSKNAMPAYHNLQTERTHLLLDLLLDDPDNFPDHCNMMGASVTIAALYGYDVDLRQTKDRFQAAAETGALLNSQLLAPGATIIAVLPFLRHIPPWFPGASTQKKAAEARAASALFRNEPVVWLKRNMAAGKAKDCIAARLVEKYTRSDGSVQDEELIRDALAGVYVGGVETMKNTLNVFFMTMTLHRAEQKKAQEEIDRIVGSGRLPTFNDRTSLPYVEALYREVLRWRPVLPLGFVHATVEDDVYKGYFIPKGAFIFPSTWAITRNEAVYPDPESFKPERFFKPGGTLNDDKISYGFGYGRRICAGIYMADAVLWVTMASLLATFDIKKAMDKNGVEIDVDPNAFSDGIATHPLPYKCSILPRSRQAELLVRNAAIIARENLTPPVDV